MSQTSATTAGPRRKTTGVGSEHVYDAVKDAISMGEYAPGAALVEAELASRFGVSRTPIREALGRLERDGIVERVQRGLVVRAPGQEEILEIYETRVILEGGIAAAAALRRSDTDLIRLEALQRRMEGLDPASTEPAKLASTNLAFHEAVWAAGHNATLLDLLARMQHHVTRYATTTLTYPGRWEEAIREHRAILDAIVAGDAARAKSSAEAHFSHARDTRIHQWVEEIEAE